jgi:cell division protein FtsZ
MDKTMKAEQVVAMLSKGMIEPKITVVGCGGAGNNIVQSIYSGCRSNVETVAVNTDERKLAEIEVHKKVLIGKDITEGKGANGFPEVGEYCAECARPTFKKILSGSDIVIVVAGMGGGTGTGVAPIVAEVSKELDAVTFAIAINPFSFETERTKKASDGVKRLQAVTNNTIVFNNDRLLELAGDSSVCESFAIVERSIMRIIDSLCTQISESFISSIAPEVEEIFQSIEEEPEQEAAMIAPTAELMQATVARLSPKMPEIGNPLMVR